METITRSILNRTITLRKAGTSPYYVSACGEWVVDARRINLTHHYGETRYRYKMIQNGNYRSSHIYIHRLVAAAWIWNPAPQLFNIVDHINGDSQDNRAANLRWVSKKLNNLNKKRKNYARKRIRPGKRRAGVYWVSSVQFCKIPYTKTFSCELSAQRETRLRINELFITHYNQAKDGEEAQVRADHMLYWGDIHPTLIQSGWFDTGVQRPDGGET